MLTPLGDLSYDSVWKGAKFQTPVFNKN